MEITLQDADPGQNEFLYRLYASTRQQELAALNWGEQQKEMFLRMQFAAQSQGYRAAHPHAEHKIIFCGGEPVGRILVDSAEDNVRLVDIAILPEQRNQGIGTRLIEDWIKRCDERGLPFRLQVLRQNAAAQRLYLRLGFAVSGEDPMYLQMERKPV